MTTLDWHGRIYYADDRGENGIYVGAPRGGAVFFAKSKASNEADAVRWLSSMSLRKGKARELVAAEVDKKPIIVPQLSA